MSSSVWFQRSPRMQAPLPSGEVEMTRPPAVPNKPTFPVSSIAIPIVTTLASAGIMYYMNSKTGNASTSLIYMASSGVALISSLLLVVTHFFRKRTYKKLLKKRVSDYEARLAGYEEQLKSAQTRQQLLLSATHPSPAECEQRVSTRASTLWERSPRDDDFLALRLGTGRLPMTVTVKPPRQEDYETDPLVASALELIERYSYVENGPICLPLTKSGVVGVVGRRADVLSVIRTMTVQLASHHAPDEVKVAAVFGEDETAQWSWMRWLPHTWDDERKQRFLANDAAASHRLGDHMYELFKRRRGHSGAAPKNGHLPRWVCILSAPQLIENEPVFPMLLRHSEEIGACTILLADRKESLPMDCSVIVQVHDGHGLLMESDTAKGLRNTAFIPDQMAVDKAEQLARSMAPLRTKSLTAGEIPNLLTFTGLYGIRRVEELQVAERWSQHRFPNTLPVAVGVRSGGKPVLLNIHDKIERKGHGPHGLLAGTTGSGKSEVIQSLIAALAAEYHPNDVAFMLIDYKGGGMSNTFANLPHVIGSITNLEDPSIIQRAQVSLRAELQRRQRLFNEAGNLQHIDEYYKSSMRDTHPLPHLVIVIDEFAELKRDHPDFMSELISIAAIGRTLGVHLILATQKPAGVVDDKIWSNARFRICLRVQDEADSRDMLKRPDAAWITNPGRGYLQVGTNEVFELFQSAWTGAPYRPDEDVTSRLPKVAEVRMDGTRVNYSGKVAKTEGDDKRQLQVLTEYLRDEAQRLGLEPLPGPWTPPLPRELYLDEIGPEPVESWKPSWWERDTAWLSPTVGLLDDLTRQDQRPVRLDLSNGHLGVYGMPGTGKTTFLQTLVMSTALQHSPDDVHCYIVDFGRMMRDFSLLPHVGDVVQGDDSEKMMRLFRLLGAEVDRRKELFSNSGAKTLAAYRKSTGTGLPAIVVVIDGYVSFRSSCPNEHEVFETLIRESANFGVYFVISAHRVADMLDKVRSNLANAVAFELADASEYYAVVGRPSRPLTGAPEGRAFVKGHIPPLEFQAALPIRGEDDVDRTQRLRKLLAFMKDVWNAPGAPAIPVLKEVLPLYDLLEAAAAAQPDPNQAWIGVDTDDLHPFRVSLSDGPHFIVAGRMEGGRTTALVTWLLSLSYQMSPQALHMYLIDVRPNQTGLSSLRELPHVKTWAANQTTVSEALQKVRADMDARESFDAWALSGPAAGETYPTVVVAMDDADLLAKQSPLIQSDLEYIVRNGRDRGVHVLIAGLPGELKDLNYSNPWLADIKNAQRGLLLGTAEYSDLQYFGQSQPLHQKGMLPAGVGYYIRRTMLKIMIATAYTSEHTPEWWQEMMTRRWSHVETS